MGILWLRGNQIFGAYATRASSILESSVVAAALGFGTALLSCSKHDDTFAPSSEPASPREERMKQYRLPLFAAFFMFACSSADKSDSIDDPDASIPEDNNRSQQEKDAEAYRCKLGDPNRFVINSCGINGRDILEQRCALDPLTNEYIWIDVSCEEHDVCKDADTSTDPFGDGETWCGPNDRGVMILECISGQWDIDSAECNDTDVCTDEQRRLGEEICGARGLGLIEDICENGTWSLSAGECGFATHEELYLDLGAIQYFEGNSWFGEEMNIGENQDELTVLFWVKNPLDLSGTYFSNSNVSFTCSRNRCQANSQGRSIAASPPYDRMHFWEYGMVAIVFTHDNFALYIDKAKQGTTPLEMPLDITDKTMTTERDVVFAHLAIFDRALTSEEVENLYSRGF